MEKEEYNYNNKNMLSKTILLINLRGAIMRKIFIFSFDDGTVYDERFIKILNKHGIPCTFNLNSKLADYVWECQGHEIRRFHLESKPELYEGHEIASHTATHPMITELTEEELICEIRDDCENLKNIFGVEEFGFGVPFDQCTEREIEIVRKSGLVKYMRIPYMPENFELPKDAFHIGINGLHNEEKIKEKILEFSKNTLEESVFVMAGHSYDLEVEARWDYFEELLIYLKSFEEFEFMTMMDFVKNVLGA